MGDKQHWVLSLQDPDSPMGQVGRWLWRRVGWGSMRGLLDFVLLFRLPGPPLKFAMKGAKGCKLRCSAEVASQLASMFVLLFDFAGNTC